MLRANLIFEIKLLLGELVLELGNFLEGQSVFDGYGDLRPDLAKEVLILLRERGIAKTSDIKRAQYTLARNERNAALYAHTLGDEPAGDIGVKSLQIRTGIELRQTRGKRPSGRGGLHGDGHLFVN